MARLRRIRRVLKWGGLVLSLMIAAAWATSLRWTYGYGRPHRPCKKGDARTSDESLTGLPDWRSSWMGSYRGVGGGSLYYSRQTVLTRLGWETYSYPMPLVWRPSLRAAGCYGSFVILPLWIPFLLIAVPTAFFLWPKRRIPPGHCQFCGYDLTGNVSGTCPECGSAVADQTRVNE